MPLTQENMERVNLLVKQGKVDAARTLLMSLSGPKAEAALQKLNDRYPPDAVQPPAPAPEKWVTVADMPAAAPVEDGMADEDGMAEIKAATTDKRENSQRMFAEIGNCIACIEVGGKDTEHFREVPFANKEYLGIRIHKGHASAYRYANLIAVRAKLTDLREEVQRIRNWDANQSREETLARIAKYLDEAKHETTRQAERAVAAYKEMHATHKRYCLIAALPTCGISLFFLMLGADNWSPEYKLPTCWQDMLEAAGS